jgi:predicted flap endonuclease-1-like 5' DNA nuclease
MCIVAVVIVALYNIVLERPLGEWIWVLLLVLLAGLIGWWWAGRRRTSSETVTEQTPASSSPHVREYLASEMSAPALQAPAPAPEPAPALEPSLPEEPVLTTFAAAPVPEAPAEAVETAAESAPPPEAPAPTSESAEDDLLIIEGIGPQMEAALKAANIRTYRQVADASVQDLRAAIEVRGLRFAPSLVNWAKQARFLASGDQAGFERYRDHLVRGLEPGQSVSKDYVVTMADATAAPPEQKPRRAKAETAAAAPKTKAKKKPQAARKPKAEKPPEVVKPDDLKVIEGIGPKMEKALNAAGIMTFARLAATSEDELRTAIEAQGLRFAPSIPTWAKQARLLADGDQAGFEAYKDRLIAGREA